MKKFTFKCYKCSEQFNVEFEHMLNKEALVCPNCSNTLPDDALNHLKTVVKSLRAYWENSAHNGMENENYFSVTIQ